MNKDEGFPNPKPQTGRPEHNILEMTDNELIQAVKKDFNIELTYVHKVTSGLQNQVYKGITLGGEIIFIRSNKENSKFEIETYGYKVFSDLGVPVPRVLVFNSNPETLGVPTMIVSAAEGLCLNNVELSSEQEESVYREWGRVLKKIHSISLPGFGPVKFKNGKPQGKYDSFKEQCDHHDKGVPEMINVLISNGLITEKEAQKIRGLFKEIGSLDVTQGFLLHRDFNKEHIFISGGKITGIIDLGRLEVGDPRNEIGKSLLYMTPKQREYFIEEYGELARDEVVKKYLVLRAATMAFARTKRGQSDVAQYAISVFRKTISSFK